MHAQALRYKVIFIAQKLRTFVWQKRNYCYHIVGDIMNELKKIRTSLNMSQVDAAKVLGISRRTYQKYEALEDESDNKLKYYIFRC